MPMKARRPSRSWQKLSAVGVEFLLEAIYPLGLVQTRAGGATISRRSRHPYIKAMMESEECGPRRPGDQHRAARHWCQAIIDGVGLDRDTGLFHRIRSHYALVSPLETNDKSRSKMP